MNEFKITLFCVAPHHLAYVLDINHSGYPPELRERVFREAVSPAFYYKEWHPKLIELIKTTISEAARSYSRGRMLELPSTPDKMDAFRSHFSLNNKPQELLSKNMKFDTSSHDQDFLLELLILRPHRYKVQRAPLR
jgi:hypothetical protein